MATGTTDGAPSRRVGNRRPKRKPAGMVEYGQYIERQLNRTGSQVKGSDLFGGLLLLAAGALAYLLLVVLIDHWVVAGGLGFWSRLLALAGFVIGAGVYLALFLLPPLLRQVNPVYAAHAIERGQPGLKNSLINFLLLKPGRSGMPAPVYDAIEEQAATGLAGVSVESAVDRSHLVRFGMILLGIVAACAVYIVLSPKDPLASAARVMVPWADIGQPTRISIENVAVEIIETGARFEDGNASVVVGQHVKITASMRHRGLPADETAAVRFSTLDSREIVDQQVPMQRGEFQQYIVLPVDDGSSASQQREGLRQSIEYSIVAGDAVEGPYKIDVTAAPTIEVAAVDYEFPSYTRLPAERVDGQGDIRGLEGTTVTVRALANQDIRNVNIDFDCDGHTDEALLVDGRRASVSFVLQLREDRITPEHDCYLLRFTNQAGHENRQPVRYRIEVTPDLPPEIEFTAPEAPAEIEELAASEALPLAVRAVDRDFDLAEVVLRAELAGTVAAEGQKQWEQTLLDEPRIDQFRSEPVQFVPRAYGFEPGDTIEYWAEARDNRRPEANLTVTQRYRVKIIAPPEKPDQQGRPEDNARQPPNADQDPADQDGTADDSKQPDPNEKQQPGDPSGDANQGDQRQPGAGDDQGDGQRQPGDAGDGQQTEPGAGDGQPAEDEGVDPDAQDGDAFERIMEHLEKQGKAGGDKPADPGAEDGQRPDADDMPPEPADGAGTPGPRGNDAEAAQDGQAPGQESTGTPSGTQDAGAQDNANRQPDGQPPADATSDQGESNPEKTDGDPKSENRQPSGDASQASEENSGAANDPQKSAGGAQQPADGNMSERGENAADGGPKPADADAQKDDSQSGVGDQPKGSPGDGQQTPEENRSPDAQGGNAPRDKQPDAQDPTAGETPTPAESPSNSKHESDTPGDELGDRSGEGEKGGGQRADQQGSGAAGRNQPADQGAGAAEESGDGETADRPGDKQPAGDAGDNADPQNTGAGNETRPGDKDTGADGQQSTQPGDGSRGAQPEQGDSQQPPADGQPGAEANDGSQNPAGDPAKQDGSPGDIPTGGNRPAERNGTANNAADKPAARDTDPNLDYAKKATDLVLENLKDQLAKDQPDQELLDKLKWSREDLQRFVERWEKMRQAADTPGAAGQQASEELDAALRGLGLRPRGTSIGADSTEQDRVRGLRQTGRSQPPAEYSELFKQYTTGTAKGLPSERK